MKRQNLYRSGNYIGSNSFSFGIISKPKPKKGRTIWNLIGLFICACVITASFLGFSNAHAESVDLRDYYPSSPVLQTYINDNYVIAKRSIWKFPRVNRQEWNLRKKGYFMSNNKQAIVNGRWKSLHTAMLYLANDQSVTEVGGIMHRINGIVESFESNGRPTGINWGHAGGTTSKFKTKEFNIKANGGDINQQAYSSTKLIERLEYYKPEKSNKTYYDVVHTITYHGSKYSGMKKVRCNKAIQKATNDVPYKSYKDYNSYAIERWQARGIGIIKDINVFIENDKSRWPALPTCSGKLFTGQDTFTSYILD